MKLRKTILLAALPLMLFCLPFAGLPGVTGTANADLKLSNPHDDQKVKNFCKSHLPDGASRLAQGACYEGYVLGYNNKSDSACDSDYSDRGAVHYCKTVGYNGGLHNSANIIEPPTSGPGSPGGHGGGGSTETCGDSPGIAVSISIGCKGKGNAIADMAFAIIRVLSMGVGLVVVGSIVVGGIQYSASRGDPQSTAMAINRIRSSLFALLIYIFGFALLNYIIPGAILQ